MDTPTKDSTAPAPRYRFYRMFCGEKIYLFCQIALTPNRSSAALPNFKVVTEWPVEAIYSVHKEQVYARALAFIDAADEDLTTGRRHFRTKAGTLLTTLDEVVRAASADDLVIGKESKVGEMTAEDHRRIMRVVYRQHTRRYRERRRKKKLQLAT